MLLWSVNALLLMWMQVPLSYTVDDPALLFVAWLIARQSFSQVQYLLHKCKGFQLPAGPNIPGTAAPTWRMYVYSWWKCIDSTYISSTIMIFKQKKDQYLNKFYTWALPVFTKLSIFAILIIITLYEIEETSRIQIDFKELLRELYYYKWKSWPDFQEW